MPHTQDPSAGRAPTDEPQVPLETALQRLDEIADQLESGDAELEASLRLYEEGVRLLRAAERVLGAAETRIEQLRADGDRVVLEPLPEEEDR